MLLGNNLLYRYLKQAAKGIVFTISGNAIDKL
jgi:hypothetical protein